MYICDTTGNKESINSLLQGSQSHTWNTSLSDEFDRLAQGIHDVYGNDVVDFISKSEVSSDCIVTYANMV